MHKFKIGDRVRTLKNEWIKKGVTGIVCECISNTYVRFQPDDWDGKSYRFGLPESQVELIGISEVEKQIILNQDN